MNSQNQHHPLHNIQQLPYVPNVRDGIHLANRELENKSVCSQLSDDAVSEYASSK